MSQPLNQNYLILVAMFKLLTWNEWKVSLTLDPSATLIFHVQLEETSYSSGKFFVVNMPDSPSNSYVHDSEIMADI